MTTHVIDILVVPESSNTVLNLILSQLNMPITTINKQNSAFVVNSLNTEKMQKAEKEKLMSSLENVNSVKMAQLSANQRKRVANHLFKVENDSVFKDKNILFFDDALFTGSTLTAIQKLIPINHALVMFSFNESK